MPKAQIFLVDAPVAKAAGVDDLYALFAGNSAGNNFPGPGPLVQPDVPRNARVLFQAGWDGGVVTISGFDRFGNFISETIADTSGGAGGTEVGSKVFKSITGATKSAVGAAAAAASIGVGDKLGTAAVFPDSGTAVLVVDDTSVEPVTVDSAEGAFTPTSAPDGAHVYKLIANVA